MTARADRAQLLSAIRRGYGHRAKLVNEKGHVIGEDHHRARLTDHEVDLILALRAEGLGCRDIAEKFEVSYWTVRAISCGGRRWQTARST